MSRNIARMTAKKSPSTKQTTMRLPLSLHAEIASAAEEKGWSFNDEVNFRLRAFSLDRDIKSVAQDVTEIKAMIQRLADSD